MKKVQRHELLESVTRKYSKHGDVYIYMNIIIGNYLQLAFAEGNIYVDNFSQACLLVETVPQVSDMAHGSLVSKMGYFLKYVLKTILGLYSSLFDDVRLRI